MTHKNKATIHLMSLLVNIKQRQNRRPVIEISSSSIGQKMSPKYPLEC